MNDIYTDGIKITVKYNLKVTWIEKAGIMNID